MNVMNLARPPLKNDVPVEVVVRHLLNSSRKGGVVLDVIVGTGSTLIAAQKTGRKLIGYVARARDMDQIRARWTRFVHGPKASWTTLTTRVGV
jgi:DNA modification methylase